MSGTHFWCEDVWFGVDICEWMRLLIRIVSHEMDARELV